MHDPDIRKFLLWASGILLMFWTIGYGLNAAVILAVPEPLPQMARATEIAVVEGWEGPGDFRQSQLLDELAVDINAIELEALQEVGINPFAIDTADGCGRAQYDYDPILKRMMPAGADRLQ